MQTFSNFGQDGSQLLSPKEIETVRLIASGFSDKQTSEQLKVGCGAVRMRLLFIKAKLKHQGIHNRTHLVRWAISLNILK
jgi:DNA-binding CsgD family transcriptional regulator